MRACSFLPAATSIVDELGLSELLIGVTFECPLERPRVVRSVLEGEQLSSSEIDRRVREASAAGANLYRLDEELLEELAPDIIFTQDVCSVCQIDSACVEKAIAGLSNRPRLVPLSPRTFPEVLESIQTIATSLGHPERGSELRGKLETRIERVREAVAKKAKRKVIFLEWLDPLFCSGHWIPEQVEIAGGVDLLGCRGGYSSAIEWEEILVLDPDVIIASACGFDERRSAEELLTLGRLPGWAELKAVKNGHVYAAGSKLFTQPSSLLVDGIELLAEIFHFASPQKATHSCLEVTVPPQAP